MPSSDPSPTYKRILLKLSGEALMGDQQFGVDPAVATRIARDIAEIQALGVETAIVIGGGNIFRGLAASASGMDRATGDYMGMLATVINGLALSDALEQQNVVTRVVSAIEMRAVAEPFIRRRAVSWSGCDGRLGWCTAENAAWPAHHSATPELMTPCGFWWARSHSSTVGSHLAAQVA